MSWWQIWFPVNLVLQQILPAPLGRVCWTLLVVVPDVQQILPRFVINFKWVDDQSGSQYILYYNRFFPLYWEDSVGRCWSLCRTLHRFFPDSSSTSNETISYQFKWFLGKHRSHGVMESWSQTKRPRQMNIKQLSNEFKTTLKTSSQSSEMR